VKIPTPVVKVVGRHMFKIKKHSPELLLVSGVVGVVTSTVLACRATLKLEQVLDEHERTIEKVKAVEISTYTERHRQAHLAEVRIRAALSIAKLYAPSVTLGVLSVGCLVGSHRILSTRNAGIMAAYATLEKGFEEYRARVTSEVGEEKERELRFGKTVTTVDEDGRKRTVFEACENGPSTYAVFFDEFNPNWNNTTPFYNQMFLKCQQQYANDMLTARGHVTLNDVYDMLGLPRTKAGFVVGWLKNGSGDGYVDFGIFDGDIYKGQRFANGDDDSVLLDFNVDGIIYDKI
jgi:hypothetical protein